MKYNQQISSFKSLAWGLGSLACVGALQAEVVHHDTFTDTDQYQESSPAMGVMPMSFLPGHTVDVTSTDSNWIDTGDEPGGWTKEAFASNTYYSMGRRGTIGFTALGAGKTLRLTYVTTAIGWGQSSDQGSGFELLNSDGDSVFGIGDNLQAYNAAGITDAAVVAAMSWSISQKLGQDLTTLNTTGQTTTARDNTSTVAVEFNYVYDAGAWTLSLTDTTTITEFWTATSEGTCIDGSSTYAPVAADLTTLRIRGSAARATTFDEVQVEINDAASSPLKLEIALIGDDLKFTWAEVAGTTYKLRSDTELGADPLTWDVFATDVSSPYMVARPVDAATFFILEADDLFSDELEGDTSEWSASGTSDWALGTPNYDDGADTAPNAANTPDNCWGTNLTGNYAPGQTDSWLRSPTIDLTGVATATLSFRHFVAIDNVDDPNDEYGEVRIVEAANPANVLATLETPIDGVPTGRDHWRHHHLGGCLRERDPGGSRRPATGTAADLHTAGHGNWR